MNRVPMLAALLVLGVLAPNIAFAQDADGDGVVDVLDDCISSPNPNQRDTDADGYGNLCDQDLNNDGVVNSLDLGLFRAAFQTSNANADFNGDQLVNSQDLGLFSTQFLHAPGPSRVIPNPKFDSAPPSASQVDFFALGAPGPNGENGAVRVRYADNERPGPTVSMVAGPSLIVLNDLGLGADQTAGDGLYTGFTNLDPEEMRSDEEFYLARLNATQDAHVTLFAGRDVIGRQPFSTQAAMAALAPTPQASESATAAGVPMTLIPSALSAVRTLALTVSPAKTLAITSPSVVANPGFTFDPCNTDGTGNNANPNNPWSFKTLMANMAFGTGLTTQQFIHQWLRNWMTNDIVNSFTITARPGVQDYFPGWDGVNAATLNVNNLPFRLLAIMNRLDLAKVSYGGASAGETRFVFGLLDLTTCAAASISDRMTTIFEYGDTATTCPAIKSRANDWIALNSLVLGSPAYMTALKAITDAVTLANAVPSKPNGSALNQLRTNDFAFDGKGSFSGLWELREFRLQAPASPLRHSTIKQTPAPVFRTGNPVTAQFWELNANAILCEQHTVPEKFPTPADAFLGSSIGYGAGSFWIAPTHSASLPAAFPACNPFNPFFVNPGLSLADRIQSELRHKFSINTCDDCHSGETTTQFVHVDPTTRALSGFLTGIHVNDPVVGAQLVRAFNDLDRRGQILEDLAVRTCFGGFANTFELLQAPLKFTH